MATAEDNIKFARRGPIVSIFAYLVLTVGKLVFGYLLNSSSLTADGFNNLSDIMSNVILLVGLYLASRPADEDHRFGHWKIEDLASLLTSFIMFLVGFQVLFETIKKLIGNSQTEIDPLGALVGVISALVMYGVYLYNRHLSKKVKSSALLAASKDNLSDAVTSIGTSVAIVASSLNLSIVDRIAAIIICYFILKTAYDIFIQATFSLSDGFDDKQLSQYEKAILQIPKITAVKSQRGRTYGSNIFLDLVLEMNPDLSVYESHAITEQVEQLLHDDFQVYDVDIHVEPAPIPEDEIPDNVYHKLYKFEKLVLAKIPDYETYIAEDFMLVNEYGQVLTEQSFLALAPYYSSNFQYFKMTSISQKTKLITYRLEGRQHVSIWRRHETWKLLFHQITPETER